MEVPNNPSTSAREIFPDGEAIFSHVLQDVEKIKNECYVVLDTNVLLFPYNTGKMTLEQISKTYRRLIKEERLIVPSQVAREFAKNRGKKISELFQQLSRKISNSGIIKNETYPLLESLKEYKEIQSLEKEIVQSLVKYRRHLNELLDQISAWQWNDPVTKLYRELFSNNVVLDIEHDEAEIQKDLAKRYQQKIPPGYKDEGKPDSGIGDLLIWYTILKVGEIHKRSVIFISGDEKSDWQIQSEGQALYPRYELIDEYRRKSEGASFHILSFSNFLELFDVSETVVAEVRAKEMPIQDIYSWSSTSPTAIMLKALHQFLIKNYPEQNIKPTGDIADFEIIYSDGSKIGVVVQANPVTTEDALFNLASTMTTMANTNNYKNMIVALVPQRSNDIRQFLDLFSGLKMNAKLMAWSRVAFLVGTLTRENEFYPFYFK